HEAGSRRPSRRCESYSCSWCGTAHLRRKRCWRGGVNTSTERGTATRRGLQINYCCRTNQRKMRSEKDQEVVLFDVILHFLFFSIYLRYPNTHGLRYCFVSISFASLSPTICSVFASQVILRPVRIAMLPR